MEKNGLIAELLIKFLFAIFGIIAIVFIIMGSLSMVNYILDPTATMLIKTDFGKMLIQLYTISGLSFKNILKIICSFADKMTWICFVLIAMQLVLLVINFIFVKWKLVTNYLLLSILLGLFYVVKYVFLGFDFAYLNGVYYEMDFLVGAIVYLVIALIEVLICGLFIIKFIFNVKDDFKELLEAN